MIELWNEDESYSMKISEQVHKIVGLAIPKQKVNDKEQRKNYSPSLPLLSFKDVDK